MDSDISMISCNRTVTSMILQTAVSYCVIVSPFVIDLDLELREAVVPHKQKMAYGQPNAHILLLRVF